METERIMLLVGGIAITALLFMFYIALCAVLAKDSGKKTVVQVATIDKVWILTVADSSGTSIKDGFLVFDNFEELLKTLENVRMDKQRVYPDRPFLKGPDYNYFEAPVHHKAKEN